MDTRKSDLLRALALVDKLNEVLLKLGYQTGTNLKSKLNTELDELFQRERDLLK